EERFFGVTFGGGNGAGMGLSWVSPSAYTAGVECGAKLACTAEKPDSPSAPGKSNEGGYEMPVSRSWNAVRPLIALVLAAMALLPAVSSVAAQSTPQAQTATVGVAFTLTGNNAVYGQSQQKGAELAQEEINTNN